MPARALATAAQCWRSGELVMVMATVGPLRAAKLTDLRSVMAGQAVLPTQKPMVRVTVIESHWRTLQYLMKWSVSWKHWR